MKRLSILLLAVSALFSCKQETTQNQEIAVNYHTTKKVDTVDTYFGVDVPDPYYGGNSGFQDVFSMLDQACTKIAERIS